MLHVTLIKYCQFSFYMQNRCIMSYFYLHRVPLVVVSLPCSSDHFFSTPLPSSFWCASLVWSLISLSHYLLTLMYGIFLLFTSTIQGTMVNKVTYNSFWGPVHTWRLKSIHWLHPCFSKWDKHRYYGAIATVTLSSWWRKVFKKMWYYLPSHHFD